MAVLRFAFYSIVFSILWRSFFPPDQPTIRDEHALFRTRTLDSVERYTNTLVQQYLSMAELLHTVCIVPATFDVAIELYDALESVNPAFTACKAAAPTRFFPVSGKEGIKALKNHVLEIFDVSIS